MRQNRWLALAVLATGMLMVILDGSIVTVAMPVMQRDLGFSPEGLTWVVNAYLIAFGSFLLLAGRLGDLLGRKRVLIAGTAVFVAASVLAGVATGPAVLLVARFLQGVGGAMFSAVSLGMLVTLFPQQGERARAIGVFSFTGAAGASIGQVLGGVLTDALSWHWIFLINVPIGVATLALAVPCLPSDRGLGLRAGADVLGALFVTAGLMTGIYAVVQTSGSRLLTAGASVVLLAAFIVRQMLARTPLMPLRVLRSRQVAGANVLQVLLIGAMFSFQILVALYMQRVLHYSALQTGLAMLPAALAIAAVSLGVSARLIHRFGERTILITGLVLLTAALGWLTRLPSDARYTTDLLPVMLLIAGGGLVLPAITGLGMSGARPDDAGLASGLFNTTQQLGMALGVAALSTVAAARTEAHLRAGASSAVALTDGYRLAFTIGAALLAASIVGAALLLRPIPAAALPVTFASPRASSPRATSPATTTPSGDPIAAAQSASRSGAAGSSLAGACAGTEHSPAELPQAELPPTGRPTCEAGSSHSAAPASARLAGAPKGPERAEAIGRGGEPVICSASGHGAG
ncbi:MFS transporter [Dactylosporangium vinaceum]|uniref:MFS transporter n=1 Tax=Dactylosporangium vinaceum TaxID=53362 RepID=A0ABV5MCF1_9ACTN|nr:MFS transporter [Dactylosporangium vinaceum]